MRALLARSLCLFWLLLSATEGCASVRLGSGRAQWLRVRTPHFTLHTDLEQSQARARADQLERYLAAYLQHGWEPRGELPLRLNVVMFARPSEFKEFARWETAGFYTTALFEPWVVLPSYRREEGLTILRHELTHYLAFSAMQDQPRWFAEGVACYFESARFDQEGKFVVGKVPIHRYNLLRRGALIGAERLFAWPDGPPDEAFYASAWLLVHYLMSERGDDFVRYQIGLAQGLGHDSAWQRAFPDLNHEQVDRALREYGAVGAFPYFTRPVTAKALPMQVERLSQPHEYALRALLYANCSGCGEDAKARADQSVRLALALDPRQLEASVMRIMSTRGSSAALLEPARALAAGHPDAWLAWLAFAGIALDQQDPSAFEALRRTLELAPRQAYAHLLAARAHLQAGRSEDALRASALAVSLQPTNASVLKGRAALLAALGQCEPLRQTIRALLALGHNSLSEAERAELRALSAGCASKR